MGTPSQELLVVWDTGSSRFFIESDLCSNCQNDVFITADSTTYTEFTETTTITYGDGTQLSGPYATDTVCATSDTDSCGTDFLFIAVDDQSGLYYRFDGIVGMWSGVDGSTSGLVVPQLYEQGVLSSNMFSFYMTAKADQSYIDFGEPNPTIIGDGSSVVWLDVFNNR